MVSNFEELIAAYAGSKYAVAVESGTAAIFLSLMWRLEEFRRIKHQENVASICGEISIPRHTYPSVPCSIIHAGFRVVWSDDKWSGEYELEPFEIWDSALRFKRGMYHGGLQCLSFHVKKHLPIGRGGMILTDDKQAYIWLKKARFDGRDEVPLEDMRDPILGFNMYMTPEQAARGIMLFNTIKDKDLPDMEVEKQGYPDLSKFDIYKTGL